MEPVIADLINNPKVPKWLRFAIVTLVCGFVVFLGVMLTLKSPMLVGKNFRGRCSRAVSCGRVRSVSENRKESLRNKKRIASLNFVPKEVLK